uniref:Uncharacterized protein n=1 Tax=Serinus canaria TaxID=9135 RepID=A0A8C9U9X2_SERCA
MCQAAPFLAELISLTCSAFCGAKTPPGRAVLPQGTAGSMAAEFSHPHLPKENRNSEGSSFSMGGKAAGVERLGKFKGECGSAAVSHTLAPSHIPSFVQLPDCSSDTSWCWIDLAAEQRDDE